MNRKKTAVLLFALIFLVVFYFWKAQPKQGSFFSQSEKAAHARVLQLAPSEAVSRITLKDFVKETEISIHKMEDGKWLIKQPVECPAEPLIIDGLISLLKLTPRSRELPIGGADETGLGFKDPKLKVCVSVSNAQERCLMIGNEAAIMEGAYAKWEDESKYFLVNPNFLNSFDKTLYSIRKKQVFDFPGREIMEIQFRSNQQERIIKREAANWIMTKPKESGVSTETVGAILDLLGSLYVKIFLDDIPKNDPKFGLESGTKTIEVVFKDGSKQTLIWGSEALGLDGYYALGSGEGQTPLLISRGKINQIAEKFSSLI